MKSQIVKSNGRNRTRVAHRSDHLKVLATQYNQAIAHLHGARLESREAFVASKAKVQSLMREIERFTNNQRVFGDLMTVTG